MNERILEAAFQSLFITKRVSDGSYFIDDPELMGKLEKFAELIVQECIDIVEHSRIEDDKSVCLVGATKCKIKQHFGVEE